MGFGDKLVMASEDVKKLGPLQQAMDQVGPYVHFAIMPGLDYPLGMEPEKIEAAATNPEQLGTLLKAMLSWPIKTYENPDNPWPVFCLDFKPNIDNPWAKSILEAGLPCQQFIDEIFFTTPCERGVVQSVLEQARVHGVDLRVIPDLYDGLADR